MSGSVQKVALALAVLGALVVSGCRYRGTSSPDAGVVTDDGAMPLDPEVPYSEETCTPDADDTFCPAYAEAFCTAHFACCMPEDDPGIRYATMDLCVQRTTCLCTARRQGAAAEGGRITFDATAGDALLARLREAPSSCPVLPIAEVELDTAFVGTLGEGASCSPTGSDYTDLNACGPGLYCFVSDFGDETTPPSADCRRYRAEGEECDAIGMGCAPGLYCGEGATIDDPGVCRRLLEDGAPCANDFECASDLCDEDAGNTCALRDALDTWCVDASLDL